MKYLLLILPFMFIGCGCNTASAAYCKSVGYKGVVSDVNYHSYQYCSNGELVNGNFLTDHGEVAQTYSAKGVTYTNEYIEFK